MDIVDITMPQVSAEDVILDGTFVAGVALYGDILEGQDWVGHNGIKLLDAAIFPDPNRESLDEDDLIANIQEAIKANHGRVKVWNLSVSITREVNDNKFSDFAMAFFFMYQQTDRHMRNPKGSL